MPKDKPKRKTKKYVHFRKIGNIIYEAIYFDNEPKFLCYTKDGSWRIEDQIETENMIFFPKDKTMIPYRPYVLDIDTWRKLENKTYKVDNQKLYALIFDEVDIYLDLEEKYKVLITVVIMQSYGQHKLRSIGYLFLLGPPNSGKSRVCEMFNFMSYRPMFSLDNNPADIYNYIGFEEENEGTVTIIEDEVDWTKITSRLREKLKIYRSGYRKGATVPRILDGSSLKRIQKFYRTFCLTILSGYNYPRDDALKSRCTGIPMMKGKPKKDEILEEDLPTFDSIKLDLLLWRMITYFDKLPELVPFLEGRMKEKWKGRILTASGTIAESIIIELAKSEIKSEFDEIQNSLESFILQIVLDLGEELEWHLIPFSLIWNKLMIDLGIGSETFEPGCYTVYSSVLNRNVTKQAVGRILSSVIHGHYKLARLPPDKKPERVWAFKRENVRRLMKARGIKIQEKLDEETDDLEE